MFIEWLGDTLAKGAVVTALLALGGWLSKQQISAWLTKDLERLKSAHIQQLEAKKAEYQRDLESYRVSLIAAAERSKAEAEIKKAAALFIVEKKFRAFDRLHAATLGMASDFIAAAQMEQDEKTHLAKGLLERNEELRSAAHTAEIFLTHEQKLCLARYRSLLVDFQVDHCSAGSETLPEDQTDALGDPLLLLELEVDRMLYEQVRSMAEMV